MKKIIILVKKERKTKTEEEKRMETKNLEYSLRENFRGEGEY